MDFLFGTSPIQKRVNQATDELRLVPDWGANLELCDVANRAQDSAQEVLNAVRKRMLNTKKQRVAVLSLTLLEALVKNGRPHVHDVVAKKDFMNDLVKTSRSLDYETRDKALDLIMGWADAFKDKGARYSIFYLTYQTLQSQGVDFPVRDMKTSAPVFTPAAHSSPAPSAPAPSASVPAASGGPTAEAGGQEPSIDYHKVTDKYLAKIKKDLEVVINFLTITREMLLAAVEPEVAKQDDTLTALVRNLKQIQSRFLVLIVEVRHEPLVDLIIKLNEHVFHCLEWHKNACEGLPYEAPDLVETELLESVLELSQEGDEERKLNEAREQKERDEEFKEESDDEFAQIAERNIQQKREAEEEEEEEDVFYNSAVKQPDDDDTSLLDDVEIEDDPSPPPRKTSDSLEDLLNLDLGGEEEGDGSPKQLPTSTAQLDLELLDFDAEREEAEAAEAEAERRRSYS